MQTKEQCLFFVILLPPTHKRVFYWPVSHAFVRNPAQARLKLGLPCVKGGGTAYRDGGIVKSDNLHKTIPQPPTASGRIVKQVQHQKMLQTENAILNIF